MKNSKMLTILVMALSLMVSQAPVNGAEPMGTAFTYQGRLSDTASPAEGLYDFKFSLFDDSDEGRQIGGDIYLLEVDVINSYFTVELDFGSNIFTGFARWLQIGVRPGELEDPSEYTTLSPRQEITPTPYAIYADKATYAYSAFTDNDWVISHNDMYSVPLGNVGIGTTTPAKKLTIQAIRPRLALVENDGGAGVLEFHEQENQLRLQYWTDYGITFQKTMMTLDGDTGNVGIGTETPGAKLDVEVTSGGAATIGSMANSATGDYAVAMGAGTAAGGDYSTAMGTQTVAGGIASNAMGQSTNASGDNSTAMGTITTADGEYSTAMGYSTNANGYASTAMGFGTTAGGSYSTAMGHITTTGGTASTAMGSRTTASGPYSTAMGTGTTADANYSTAMGYYTTASGWYSTAMGVFTTASGGYSTAIGKNIEAAGSYSVAIALNDTEGTIVNQHSTMAIMGGSVGIGTVAPGYTLHVVGDIAYTGSISDVSDLRLKENITPLENGVEKVSCLKGIYFNNKGESSDKREVGVIAQDVEKVLPELVSMDKQGYKSVDYTKLSAVLIEAVKEQQKQIENLQSEVKALQAIQQNQFAGEKEMQR